MKLNLLTLTNRNLITLPILFTLIIILLFGAVTPVPKCYRPDTNFIQLLWHELWFQEHHFICIHPLYFPRNLTAHRRVVEVLLLGVLGTLTITFIVIRNRHQAHLTTHQQELEELRSGSQQELEELRSGSQQELEELRSGFQMLLTSLDHELKNLSQVIDPNIPGDNQNNENLILTENMKRRLKKIGTIKDDLSYILDTNALDFKQLERLNVYELIEPVVTEEKELTKLSISLHDPFQPEEIAGHYNLLTYAFSNLIRNAIRYGRERVEVTIRRAKGGVEVRVEDDGIGIPKEDQEKIFDPKYRANNVESQSGTGIGLWLTRSIIEKHNGRVWLEESIENSGSVFQVWLPNYSDSK